ncbi:hypothetical protein EVG20_g10826 [Dentipellis fragilis]|uniref:Uncharacterized protein n=1 Tax=Dentipellis fragilis TaxID=205917 RepID=A0A4Y9XRK2_9AGAM|nr:hypothetical protein EVG20_g10826 [Dentipellis fragilis]
MDNLADSDEGPLAEGFRNFVPREKRELSVRYVYLGGRYSSIDILAQDLNVDPDTLHLIPMGLCTEKGYAYENSEPIPVAKIDDDQLEVLSAIAREAGISRCLIDITPIDEEVVKHGAYVFGTEEINLVVRIVDGPI